MGPITRLLPAPRTVALAGRPFLVDEARLCDLARVQSWLDGRAPDPWDEFASGRLGPGAALDLAEDGCTPFDGRGRALLATAEGLCAVFGVALERHHPDLGPDDLPALAAGLLPGEYGKFHRAFWGFDAVGALSRALDCVQPPGTPLSWPEAGFLLLEMYPSWTLEYAASLPLSVFRLALRRGKPAVWAARTYPGESREEQVRRQRRLYEGLPPATTEPEEGPPDGTPDV